MKVSSERLEDCQVNVFVEMDAAEVDKRLRQTARKISRQFNVPGYRKGKAPYHAVVRTFGLEAIQQEGLEGFGQELYDKALEEIDYEVYQPGELQEVEWDPFRMIVLVPITPEVEMGEYRSVRVPYEPEPVTDEDVEEYLAGTQQEHSQWVPVDEPAALGNQVMIDAEGRIGDDVVLSNEGYEMLLDADATHPLPGFHDQLVGMSPGEDKTFQLTYPEDDYQEEAAGKEATFTVRVESVKKQDVPALDDDLAMMVGDYETLDELKESVQERLEAEALQKTESEYLDKVLEAMIEQATKIEYPPQAVDREAELLLEQMERNLGSSGIDMDTYLQMLGKTREAYSREVRPTAVERLERRLVMGQVAELEGLSVEPEEIDAEIDRLSEMMEGRAEEMREMLSSPAGRLSVSSDLIGSKVQIRVLEIGKGEAPPTKDKVEGEEPELDSDDTKDIGEESTEAETQRDDEGVGDEPEVTSGDAEAVDEESIDAEALEVVESVEDEKETTSETTGAAAEEDSEPEGPDEAESGEEPAATDSD